MPDGAIHIAIAIAIVGFLVFAHQSVMKFLNKNYSQPVSPRSPIVDEKSIGEILGDGSIKEPDEHSKDDPTLEDEMAKFINNE